MSAAHITPTPGRIVLYRGKDGKVRPAIVTVAWGDFSVNLYVFGQTGLDIEDSGSKESVTHADPSIEPGCFPSWHWMPYQLGQAKKHETEAAQVAEPKTSISDQAIESQIVAKGKTAPRVTPADIEANIASTHYFTAAEGVIGAFAAAEFQKSTGDVTLPAGAAHPDLLKPSLNLLTFCVLVLRNGFTVTGESACASPENFDAEIGRTVARQNAVQKIWPLMGFALKQQLHDAAK